MNKYRDVLIRSKSSGKFLSPMMMPRRKSTKLIEVEVVEEIQKFEREKKKGKTERGRERKKVEKEEVLGDRVNSADFLKLINKLDLVANCKYLSEMLLRENEAVNVRLRQNTTQCFKILSKDKRSPMGITVKREFGNLVYYLSTKYTNPHENQYDFKFFLDDFEISEKFLKFSHEFFYLGVFAQDDAEFTVSVRFGKENNKKIKETYSVPRQELKFDCEEYRKNQNLRDSLNKRVADVMRKRRKQILQLANFKNFVRINKSPMEKLSPKWEEKKILVLSRKQQKIKEKKLENEKNLIKYQTNFEKFTKNKRFTEKEKKVTNPQKTWFKLLYFISAYHTIQRLISIKRYRKLQLLSEKSSARKLQKNVKKYILFFPIPFLSKLRSLNSLLFSSNTSRIMSIVRSQTLLIQSIKSSATSHKPLKCFSTFISKLISLQSSLKSFISFTKSRKSNLKHLWNSILSKKILENSLNPFNQYLKIPISTRDSLLSKYYHDSMRKNRVYLPAEEEISDLIEKTVNK